MPPRRLDKDRTAEELFSRLRDDKQLEEAAVRAEREQRIGMSPSGYRRLERIRAIGRGEKP